MSDRVVDAHGVLHEAVALLTRSLLDRRVCIDDEEAKDIAEACLIDTWREFAGSTIYVRRTIENLIPARDRKLYADYLAKVPIVDLVRRYKLSDSYIYRVIKRIERIGAPEQPELFP
jgi:Mor family transcriptional regulator